MGEIAGKQTPPTDAAWVWRTSQSGLLGTLTDREWRTLCALLTFADGTGRCHVGLDDLGRVLAVEPPEAADRLAELVEQRFHAQPIVRIVKDAGAEAAAHLSLWLSGWVWDRSGEADNELDLRPVYQFAERVFNRALANAEILAIRQWQEEYSFSREVIIELLEECYNKGKKRLSYMNAVARNWYDDGVRSPEDLSRRREDDHEALSRHARIVKYLGLGRKLSQPEKEFLHRWTWEWGFSDEVILRACALTVNASRPSFAYIDKVLSTWRLRGVRSVDDAERLLAEREKGVRGAANGTAVSTAGTAPAKPAATKGTSRRGTNEPAPAGSGRPAPAGGSRRKYDDLIRG